MPAPAANLPDAFVGLAPDCLEMGDERAFERPALLACGEPGVARDIEGVEHLAVDVELELLRRRRCQCARACALVAGEPGIFELVEPPLSGHPIHGLHVVRRAGDRTQQPLMPCFCLVKKACADQREKVKVASRSQQKR